MWRIFIICGKILIFAVQNGISMKNKLPGYLVGKNQLIGTVIFSVLFALIFLNVYIPFSDTAWFRLGNTYMFLFTAGFAFISILILVVSRTIMYHASKLFEQTYFTYILWCVLEVVFICLFYTFVTVDIVGQEGQSWMRVFLRSLLYGSISLIIPYVIAGMYFTIEDKNRTIRLMNYSNPVPDGQSGRKPEDKITLFDNTGALKLSVRTSDLYYIESDDNYIKVWYSDAGGEMKTYMLRCRLKTVEQSFMGGPLVRCHRKYIANLDKVKVLRKDRDLYYLDIDTDALISLPVSKTYTQNVLSHFTEGMKEASAGTRENPQ